MKGNLSALFLDRDGVINEDYGYVHEPDETVFIPGIFDLVRYAKIAGYKVIVVTNQAGIGRGYYSEEAFKIYMDWQRSVFIDNGSNIDAVYYCPHHPEYGLGSYKAQCGCRKPLPGLVMQAAHVHGIDLSRSVLVGDKSTDVACGVAAGVGCNLLFERGHLQSSDAEKANVKSLDEVKKFIGTPTAISQ